MGGLPRPYVPFVEARVVGRKQRPSVIVLESSFTSANSGAAYALAMMYHGPRAVKSYHFVVDESTVLRMVHEDRTVYLQDPQKKSIAILIADDPSESPGRWDQHVHAATLSRTADLVAQLCLNWGIKPEFLTGLEKTKWWKKRSGIIIQGHMAQGYFPKQYFLTLVSAYIETYKLKTTK